MIMILQIITVIVTVIEINNYNGLILLSHSTNSVCSYIIDINSILI